MLLFYIFIIGLASIMMGIMIFVLVMVETRMTNRFYRWLLSDSKTSKNELIFYNFWLSGVLPFIGGMFVWGLLFMTPDIEILSFKGFILFSVVLTSILIGEMRTFLFWDKYFVKKIFNGPDPDVEEYAKTVEFKMKFDEYKRTLLNKR